MTLCTLLDLIARIRRSAAVLAAALVSLVVASPAAEAGWVVFPVAQGGKSALVAENITFNPINSQFYYTFAVANTTPGLAPPRIDGFYLGVGPRANAMAGGMQFNVGPAGGADPGAGFPAAPGGLLGGTALLSGVFDASTTPLVPAATTTWGFEEFDDRGAGILPNTAYVMRWYDPLQNTNNATDLPRVLLNPLQQIGKPHIGPWLVTGAFQLVSPFGPVPGYGGIDPLSGGYLGVEESGSLLQINDRFDSSNIGNGPPPGLGSLGNLGSAPAPEPGSLALCATAAVGLGFVAAVRRWRRRATTA
jgi:hypothetical protein